MIIYCYIEGYDASIWKPLFEKLIPGVDCRPWPHWGDSDESGEAYAYVWSPPEGLLAQHKNIRAIFSLGAGVDHLTKDPSLPKDIPIIRMADSSLKDGMAEYITMAALWFLREMPAVQKRQQTKTWKQFMPRPTSRFTVGLMGYGILGKAAAEKLRTFSFPIHTWSRTTKPAEDGITHYSGKENLGSFLSGCDLVVGLLPKTPETTGLLNHDTLAQLPKGAAVVNAGRGALLDLDALKHHIDKGHLSGAMLDVFDQEPLDQNHPIWSTDGVIITPHVAAITRPDTSAAYVADCIEKIRQGKTIDAVLSKQLGY